jgi:hypothetical protein
MALLPSSSSFAHRVMAQKHWKNLNDRLESYGIIDARHAKIGKIYPE